MRFTDRLILNMKRRQSPLFRFLRWSVNLVNRPVGPVIPAVLKPLFRSLYELHYLVLVAFRAVLAVCYRHPLFQARCAKMGKNVSVQGLPFVLGHLAINIGDDVTIGGHVNFFSGRFVENPHVDIGDRTHIGWHVTISANMEVVIEEDVMIADHCRIFDSDGHPKDAELRISHAPIPLREIRPVRICKKAWIGGGACIMKGVTIGEGAIIGANSVVISDIPPYSIAIGNPAEVIVRNIGKKKRPPAESEPAPAPATN